MRLLLSFVFIYLFTQANDYFIASLVVFSVAALTDYLDGFAARKLNVSSKFGEQFDPICDKVLTLSAFVAFAINNIIPL
jgi:cardiolipin synthase